MKENGHVEVQLHTFLTSALDGGGHLHFQGDLFGAKMPPGLIRVCPALASVSSS